MEPILISRIRRGVLVGVSWPGRLVDLTLVYEENQKGYTLLELTLCSERDEGLRVTERHLYSAANHLSTSVTGGRNVTSTGLGDTLMTNSVCPSSPSTLSTLQPLRSEII